VADKAMPIQYCMTVWGWDIWEALRQEPVQIAVRLLLAGVLGGLVGAEREHHGRAAGFRTQILVCLGAALAMNVSLEFQRVFGQMSSNFAVRVDPARVAYGVMTGIGFLGAGSIMRSGAGIRGLTTAASLWCTAAIGLAVGLGMYLPALLVTVLTIASLWILRGLDRRIPNIREVGIQAVFAAEGGDHEKQIRDRLTGLKIRWKITSIQQDFTKGDLQINAEVELKKPFSRGRLLRELSKLEGLRTLQIC
jgi:putative Mg2+ transporter-C (MgtC) family protein